LTVNIMDFCILHAIYNPLYSCRERFPKDMGMSVVSKLILAIAVRRLMNTGERTKTLESR